MTPFFLASSLALRVDVGFPWTRIQATQPLGKRAAVIGLFETALFRRHQLGIGFSYRWLDRAWVIDGDVLLGATHQKGTILERGPAAEARIKVQKNTGTVLPWLSLGLRPTLMVNQYNIDAINGYRTEYSIDYTLSYTGTMGIDVQFKKGFGLGLGLDFPLIDSEGISIPGLHLSASWGKRNR